MPQQCHRFHQILGKSFLKLAGPLLTAFRKDLLDLNPIDGDGDVPLPTDLYLRLLLEPAHRVEGRRLGRMILCQDRGCTEEVEKQQQQERQTKHQFPSDATVGNSEISIRRNSTGAPSAWMAIWPLVALQL